MLRRMRQWPAPSILAASNSDSGICRKKLASTKTAIGRLKAMYGPNSPAIESYIRICCVST